MIRLVRTLFASNHTLGFLTVQGVPVCASLELPLLDNKRNVSCIPFGSYKCFRHNSPKYGECIHVTGVPKRSEILFHAGNFTDDTRGCILVGEYFTHVSDSKIMLMNSRKALVRLLKEVVGQEFELNVSLL